MHVEEPKHVVAPNETKPVVHVEEPKPVVALKETKPVVHVEVKPIIEAAKVEIPPKQVSPAISTQPKLDPKPLQEPSVI